MLSSPHPFVSLPRLVRLGVVAAAAALSPFVSSAETVLVNETFDAMRNSNGTGGDPSREDLAAAGWRFWNSNSNGSYRSIIRDPDRVSGQAMRNNSSSEHTFGFIQWDTVSLDDIGSSLSVSLDYRALAASAGDPNFELSVLLGDPIISQLGGTNPTATASGYGFRQGPGGTYGITEFAAQTGAALSLNHEAGAPIAFDDVLYQLVFSMTRTTEGIQMEFSVKGSVVSRHLEAAANHTHFNTLRLSSRNSQIDNVRITLTDSIPEPSIYARLR